MQTVDHVNSWPKPFNWWDMMQPKRGSPFGIYIFLPVFRFASHWLWSGCDVERSRHHAGEYWGVYIAFRRVSQRRLNLMFYWVSALSLGAWCKLSRIIFGVLRAEHGLITRDKNTRKHRSHRGKNMILIHFNCGWLRRHAQLIQIVQKGSEKNIL